MRLSIILNWPTLPRFPSFLTYIPYIYLYIYQVKKQLDTTPAALISVDKLAKLTHALAQLPLTRAEKLQIINDLPRSEIDVHVVCCFYLCWAVRMSVRGGGWGFYAYVGFEAYATCA